MKVDDGFVQELESYYSDFKKNNYMDNFYHKLIRYIEANLADYIIERNKFKDDTIISVRPFDIRKEDKTFIITIYCRYYEPCDSRSSISEKTYIENITRFDLVIRGDNNKVTIRN